MDFFVCSFLMIYVIWNPASAYTLLEVSRLQNKAIRAVFFEEYKKPNVHTFKNHKLPNLFQMNKYETVLLVYKLKNNLLRHNLILTTNDEIHGHEHRKDYETVLAAFDESQSK
jgi:hypothetical protein